MALTLMFYSTWYKFLLGGPLAPIKIDDAEFCFDNWWTNLLLVHNLVNRYEKVLQYRSSSVHVSFFPTKFARASVLVSLVSQCVSWTWYVAVVFQLHVATLIAVLIPLVV